MSGLEKWPKKVRHTFGNLDSQKQVYFEYGFKNKRIGAAAIIDPSSTPKKERKTKRKKAQNQRREGLNSVIWSPTAVVSSTMLKNQLTHSPTQKKNEKKQKKTQKTRKRGLEPAHLASYSCKQYKYIINSTVVQHMWCAAVKRHIFTTAAAVHIEPGLKRHRSPNQ